MLLVGEHEEDGWIYSTFNLTYRVAWEQLLLAVYGAYRFFSDPEVLVDGKPVEIGDPAEILTIAEDRNIMLRGISTVIAAPLMITFFNQVHFVNVSVGAVNDEFRDTDYEKYNKSMCQLMDSMEIMMHLPAHTAQEETSGEEGGTGDDQTEAAQETHGEAQTPIEDEAAAHDENVQEQPVTVEEPAAEAQDTVAEAQDTVAEEEPAAEAQDTVAEEEPAASDVPVISDAAATREAVLDAAEVTLEEPAGEEAPADEAQPAAEQVSPVSRLSMELGIPQPPA
ncbi:hypothetical protein [Schaalia odontolytica]|uniref:hypothetical protein n=1 Tax=Schaalia odontolytica TaxID=1660 RepID=UPI001D065274|nr:hypothetical protein [Schaalia odontolytica]MCB6401979.1 hypothetical protein [Schaalia odontolytica]